MVRLVSQCSPGVWDFQELEMKDGEWVDKEAKEVRTQAEPLGEGQTGLAARLMRPV